MIEEKLEEARLRSAKRSMQAVIISLVTICLCGLALVALSFVDFSAKKNVPAVVAVKEHLPENDKDKDRSDFEQLLQQYENELEPRLFKADVGRWNRDAFFEINELKKKAVFTFGNGEYANALNDLRSVVSKTEEILQEAERIFQENLRKARSFLAQDRYDEAMLYLEKALTVAPQSPEALELRQKIEKLPQILPLLDKIRIARTENDLEKEYGFLQQLLQLAPEREEAAARIKVVAELIKNQEFAAHISAGFASIEKGRLKDAEFHYRQAQKFDAGRSELAILQGKIAALEKSLRIRQAVKQAEQASRRDDWREAKECFARAIKDAPDNDTAVNGLARAGEILGLQARFSNYFENPYRLTNTAVRDEAENTLTQAEPVSGYSFTLKRQAEQLRQLIVKLNRPIAVTVISDNKTEVSVRSVGKVGIISKKKVHLKPGRYTFEGARVGFKSKLVQAFIPYDQDKVEVRVICDEPI